MATDACRRAGNCQDFVDWVAADTGLDIEIITTREEALLALRSGNPRRLLGRILLLQGVLAIATFLLIGPIGDGLETMRAKVKAAKEKDAKSGSGDEE